MNERIQTYRIEEYATICTPPPTRVQKRRTLEARILRMKKVRKLYRV